MPTDPVQHSIFLPKWECTVTVLYADDGTYYVLRELCGILGISNSRDQASILRDRIVTSPYIRQFKVQTPGGKQLATCIHQDILAFWLGYISDKRVRPDIAPRLIEFQKALIKVSKQLLLGLVDSIAVVAEPKPTILRLEEKLGAIPDVSWPESDDEGDDQE